VTESSEPPPDDPRGTIPLSAADGSRPRSVSLEEILREPRQSLPQADVGGYVRIAYTGLRASNCQAGLVYLPVGQGSPVHSAGVEHIITVLDGVVEFDVAGQRFRVERLGQMFLPAGVEYQYRNAGMVDVWFHNVIARHTDWPPPTAEYTPPA
jgi:quercetin dioxygenase-like cupin family protein